MNLHFKMNHILPLTLSQWCELMPIILPHLI